MSHPYRTTPTPGRPSLRRALEAAVALTVFAPLLCVPFVVGAVTEGPRRALRHARKTWRDVYELARAHAREAAPR